MAQQSELDSLKLENRFWFDIGKPIDYIIGQKDFLNYYSIAKYGLLKSNKSEDCKKLPSGC